jgi:hypothetical protein
MLSGKQHHLFLCFLATWFLILQCQLDFVGTHRTLTVVLMLSNLLAAFSFSFQLLGTPVTNF